MKRFLPTTNAAVALGVWLLVLIPGSVIGGEETIGRLFFTPERRQQLDQQRQTNSLDRQRIQVEPSLTIDGVVTRSSGKRTAWVNGSPHHEDEMSNLLRVTPQRQDPGRVRVETIDSPAATVRVGETVNRNSGQSSDLLNGGRIRVRAQPLAKRDALRRGRATMIAPS